MEDAVVWEPLWRQEYVAVSPAHRFGTDAVLLADFAAPRPGERVTELGTGCGAIALRLCAAGRPAAVHGIDLAPEAIALCRRSAAAFSGVPVPTFSVGDWRLPRSLGAAGLKISPKNPTIHRKRAVRQIRTALSVFAKTLDI